MIYDLISERKYHSAIEQVLKNRGIEDVEHYLNTTDADILNPLDIINIEKGAKLLVSHIAQNHKVMIQIDSDCDGYSSAAALMNYLNYIFPYFVQNNICYRPHTGKEHGLIIETIPEDVKLVIAPDSSSNDYEIHKTLYEKGIDVLVIDHHEAEKISEYACVINNQLCDYTTKSLSGVGMVYKFCCYLDTLLNADYAENIIDLVALGLVSDMMDLRDFETRHLVSKGLSQIRNPYFKGMTIKNEYSLGSQITPFGVAFYIAPYINAVTRSGSYEEKIVLFEAMLDFKAYEQIPSTKRGHKVGDLESRVEQACRNCTNIKNRQTKTRDASLDLIEQIIEENGLLDNKILCIQLKAEQKTSLAGLIANQLKAKLGNPILVLSETFHDVLDENGNIIETEIWWEGSGRGPEVPELEDFRSFCENSGLVEFAQGHPNAFGLGIKDSNIEEFISYSNEVLKSVDFTPSYKVDFIYNAKNIYDEAHYDLYNLMEYQNLWGQEVSNPLIVIENITITKDNITLMKGSTLKITLSGDPDISIIKFRSSEEEIEALMPQTDLGCVTINVVGVCEKNSFNDKPQIIMKDYEILRRLSYYF